MSRFRAWLTAVPGRDALERRQAYLLQTSLLVLAALFLFVGVMDAFGTPRQLPSANLLAGLAVVGLLALLRRGQFRFVGALLVGLLVIGFGYALVDNPDEAITYEALLVLPIILAGLLLPRVALLATMLAVLAVAVVASADQGTGGQGIAIRVGNFQFAVVLCTLVIDQFGGTLRAALRRAVAHEQELEDARSALQARTVDLQAAVTSLEAEMAERQRIEAERLAIETKVLEVQKLESLGVLAGGIAHDFNNLLVGIMGNAGLALADLPPGSPVREYVERIETTAVRAGELAREMLAYSGKGRFIVAAHDLSSLVRDMTQLLGVSIGKSVTLRYDLAAEPLTVEADATQLRQVVMNLVINASDAIGDDHGVITVATGRLRADRAYLAATFIDQGLATGDYAYVEVSDTGAGMDAETQARIFDPFFTTKFIGRGLGLAAVLGIVRGHRGALKVYSEVGRGSTFKMLLPTAEAMASTGPPPVPAAADWRGAGTVLVVDDEPLVRDVAEAMLRRSGLEVVTAADGDEAVRVYAADPDRFALVLLDLTMPRMSGVEVFRQIRAIRPSAAIVLMSGYSEDEAAGRFTGKGLAGFVEKPFSPADLSETMRRVLERPERD